MNYLETVGFVHIVFYAAFGAFRIWSAAFRYINPKSLHKQVEYGTVPKSALDELNNKIMTALKKL